MTPAADDAEVIAQSIVEPARFAAIFDRHFPAVHRYLERRLGRDVADSLAGEVFRIAFERRASYRLDRPLALPWLYGIAGNLLLKERRGRARGLRAVGRMQGLAVPGDVTFDVVDDRLDAASSWPRVREALNEMPSDEREILLLVAWESLSYPEIADALAIPIGTVRSRLHRGRKRLRELIDAGGQRPDEDPQRAEGRCPS